MMVDDYAGVDESNHVNPADELLTLGGVQKDQDEDEDDNDDNEDEQMFK